MNKKELFFYPYLKGIGQIMLQGNSITGILFMIGMLINSPTMALASLVATIVATETAKLLRYDPQHISDGLFGFNAALIGAGLLFFYQSTLIIWILVVFLSAVSAVVMQLALKYKVPVYTFPFIFLTWGALYFVNHFFPINPGVVSPLIHLENEYGVLGDGLGFGEVIFQGNCISGILFFFAVFINSPMGSLYGLFGVVCVGFIAHLLGLPLDLIQHGAFGFNAVLCAIVFAGLARKDMLFVIISLLLSVLIQFAFIYYDFVGLTFPFVLSTWITLFVKNKILDKISPVNSQPNT